MVGSRLAAAANQDIGEGWMNEHETEQLLKEISITLRLFRDFIKFVNRPDAGGDALIKTADIHLESIEKVLKGES